jgi:Cys-tRNA(Pro) deacylase
VDRGGTAEGALQLGLDEHSLVKTLIMEDDLKKPFIVLMHGDREVSTKELARIIGVKRITPCTPATAQKHSGYMVGGTSPFGTRKTMPVYMEDTIGDLQRIYINGGKRGYLVGIDPKELLRVLNPTFVRVAI